MQYVKGTNQELLTTSPQFPALVIAHQGFDKARLHWHEGFEVVYVRRCRATVMKGTQRSMHHAGDVVLIPPRCLHSIELIQRIPGSTPCLPMSLTTPNHWLQRTKKTPRMKPYSRMDESLDEYATTCNVIIASPYPPHRCRRNSDIHESIFQGYSANILE